MDLIQRLLRMILLQTLRIILEIMVYLTMFVILVIVANITYIKIMNIFERMIKAPTHSITKENNEKNIDSKIINNQIAVDENTKKEQNINKDIQIKSNQQEEDKDNINKKHLDNINVVKEKNGQEQECPNGYVIKSRDNKTWTMVKCY